MASDAVMAAARAGEPDRFVAALLAPAAVRNDLLALAAFSAELRRIPDSVTEPMMGEIRLQWWRDTIAAASGPTGYPIADALLAVIAKHNLPRDLLEATTEARAFDLYDDPMPDRAALDGYLHKTEGLVFDLAHRVLTGQAAPPGAILAASGGYGLARLLADVPRWLLQRRRHPLPGHVTLTPEGDLEATGRDLFARLIESARASHTTLRRSVGRMTRRERAAFLPTATVSSYLALTRSFKDVRDLDPTRRMVRIAWAHMTGR
jgi:15-cis-phytoene synthase